MAIRTRSMVWVLFFLVFTSASSARAEVKRPLHVDPSVEECSIALSPELSHEAFARFGRQAGLINSSQRTPPNALGRLGFEFGVEGSATPLDEWDDAWHHTFVHPNGNHPLNAMPLKTPRVFARLGVAERWDVSTYFFKAPGANFTFWGSDVKATVLDAKESAVDLALRLSHTITLGVADLILNTGGLDVSVGRTFGMFTPYLGAGGVVSVVEERTTVLDYGAVVGFSPRAFLGAAVDLWHFRVLAEADLAEVQTYTFRVGMRF